MAKKELIVFLKKETTKLYQVTASRATQIAQDDAVWQNLANHKVKIVVADELCYLLNLEIKGEINRHQVGQAIAAEIPDNLTNNWDFARFPNQNKVFVFALINDYRQLLDNLSQKFSFKIIALEPESVAVKRNPDPVIGIYLKDDLGKKDEDSLNLPINPDPRSSSKPVSIIIIILGLITALFFTFKIFSML